MRIAVCFSGEIRTGVESSENILNFIGDLIPNVDFFTHTWNYETKKNYNGCRIIGRITTDITQKIKKFNQTYKPKKIVIEEADHQCSDIDMNLDIGIIIKSIPPLWYSFYKSVQYKREYEVENGFEYDYVIKLRPDIIFSPVRKLREELELIIGNKNGIFFIENLIKERENLDICDDVYFFSKSKEMDLASQYYNVVKSKIKTIYNQYPFNYGFIEHLKQKNIEVHISDLLAEKYKKNNSYTIYREECLKLSPIKDYQKCFECNSYYFDIPNSKHKRFFINDLKVSFDIEKNIEDVTLDKKYYVDELKPKKRLI